MTQTARPLSQPDRKLQALPFLTSLLITLLLLPVLESRMYALSAITLLTIFGGLIGNTRARPILWVTSWIVAFIYVAICTTPLTLSLAQYFVAQNEVKPTTKADAVVVLSAESPEADRLKSQGIERLLHGMRIIEAANAPTLVVTELPWYRGDPRTDRAAILGEIDKVTLHVGPVENTFEEAKAVNALAVTKGWSRLILVTSPLHSRRAEAIFRDQNKGIEIISSPAEAREFDLEYLDSSFEKLKVARLMVYEIAAWTKNYLLGRL